MSFISYLYPRAELLRLRAERATLIQAQRNATDAAIEAQQKLREAQERENAALTRLELAVKQVANYAVFAGGSRIPIFPEVGPELPKPKYTETPPPIEGRKRASQAARSKNSDYLRQYQEDTAEASLPPIDIEAELNRIYEQSSS